MNFTKSTKLDHVLYAVLAPSIEEIRIGRQNENLSEIKLIFVK